MKKVLFGIFAHPDDEAFGPSGSLYKLTKGGTEVHLLLVTDGAAGKNSNDYKNLKDVRLLEWQKSGRLIGASSMNYLGYNDGELTNNLYLEVADKLLKLIKSVLNKYTEPVEVSFVTFEPRGISGHLDHIAVSMITTYVYLTLKQSDLNNTKIENLKYFCISKTQTPKPNTNWIYMPAGYKTTEIDETVDISDVYEQKLKIMKAHESQEKDMNYILKNQKETNTGQQEHFIHFKG